MTKEEANLKYKKKIGKYTIVADTPPKSKGAHCPDGSPLKKNEDGVAYEQDYFKIYVLKNLHVIDEAGVICTPIITEIEVMNSGYVCTWSSIFWVQGFAIINDDIYFVSISKDEDCYHSKNLEFNKIKLNTANAIDYKTFIETMIEPTNMEIKVNLNLNDWWSGENKLSDYMLLKIKD